MMRKSPPNRDIATTTAYTLTLHIALSANEAIPAKLLNRRINQIDDILVTNVSAEAFADHVGDERASTG